MLAQLVISLHTLSLSIFNHLLFEKFFLPSLLLFPFLHLMYVISISFTQGHLPFPARLLLTFTFQNPNISASSLVYIKVTHVYTYNSFPYCFIPFQIKTKYFLSLLLYILSCLCILLHPVSIPRQVTFMSSPSISIQVNPNPVFYRSCITIPAKVYLFRITCQSLTANVTNSSSSISKVMYQKPTTFQSIFPLLHSPQSLLPVLCCTIGQLFLVLSLRFLAYFWYTVYENK